MLDMRDAKGYGNIEKFREMENEHLCCVVEVWHRIYSFLKCEDLRVMWGECRRWRRVVETVSEVRVRRGRALKAESLDRLVGVRYVHGWVAFTTILDLEIASYRVKGPLCATYIPPFEPVIPSWSPFLKTKRGISLSTTESRTIYEILLRRTKKGRETRIEDRRPISITQSIFKKVGYLRDVFCWSSDLTHITLYEGWEKESNNIMSLIKELLGEVTSSKTIIALRWLSPPQEEFAHEVASLLPRSSSSPCNHLTIEGFMSCNLARYLEAICNIKDLPYRRLRFVLRDLCDSPNYHDDGPVVDVSTSPSYVRVLPRDDRIQAVESKMFLLTHEDYRYRLRIFLLGFQALTELRVVLTDTLLSGDMDTFETPPYSIHLFEVEQRRLSTLLPLTEEELLEHLTSDATNTTETTVLTTALDNWNWTRDTYPHLTLLPYLHLRA